MLLWFQMARMKVIPWAGPQKQSLPNKLQRRREQLRWLEAMGNISKIIPYEGTGPDGHWDRTRIIPPKGKVGCVRPTTSRKAPHKELLKGSLKRVRRYQTWTEALHEIQKYQRSTKLLFSKHLFLMSGVWNCPRAGESWPLVLSACHHRTPEGYGILHDEPLWGHQHVCYTCQVHNNRDIGP